jgi:hypothetical protein
MRGFSRSNASFSLIVSRCFSERVLKVQKTALKPSEHQIYHSNMNEGSA